VNVPVGLLVGRNSPGFLGETANWLAPLPQVQVVTVPGACRVSLEEEQWRTRQARRLVYRALGRFFECSCPARLARIVR
jgi:hypothetical protein